MSDGNNLKVCCKPTSEMFYATINGVVFPTRIWRGLTASGVAVELYVLAIMPENATDDDKLSAEIPPFMRRSHDTFEIGS